jgi:hypothetical protein
MTNIHALGIAVAQIADHDFIVRRMHVRDSSGTGVDAFSATSAFLIVCQDSAGPSTYGQSFERTGFNTWVVFTLSA